MKRTLTLCLVLAMLTSMVLFGSAAASEDSCSYAEEKNVYIDLELHQSVADQLLLLGLAGQSFATQEEAHQMACEQGAEIQHFYIVLQINGEAFLYIDPPIAYE